MDVLTTPPLPLAEWLRTTTETEYLDRFVRAGGAAVKLVILDEAGIKAASERLAGLGTSRGMLAVHVDAAATRANLMHELFFAVSRAVPRDTLAQRYVEGLFTANAYAWPRPGEGVPMAELADAFAVAPALLARQRDQWLTADLWEDRLLAQDFRGAVLRLCLARLDPDGEDAAAPVLQWLRGEKVPASLLRRSSTAPETVRRVARLWSGAKVGAAPIRQALSAAGAGKLFLLRPVPAAEFAEQLTRFLLLLFRGAGYAGWCILLDEVELIGRYTPLQRAMAYARLADWLGLEGARRVPGIVAAYAVTDDFAAAVINQRLDSEKLPERLALKGRDADVALALAGIRRIEQVVQRHRLLPPASEDLAACHDKVQALYRTAYAWPPPPLPPGERTASRTMRQYVKGWITQWDLLRLDGSAVRLVSDGIASNYAEETALAEPPDPTLPELDAEEG